MSYRASNKHCNIITKTTFDKKVGVEIVFSDTVTLSWLLRKKLNPTKLEKCEPFQPRIVEGVTFEKSTKALSSDTLLAACADLETSIKFVVDYILSLFPCAVNTLELDMNFFSDFAFLSNGNFVKSCKDLILRADSRTTKKSINDVVNMVKGYENLKIKGYNQEAFYNEKMISLKRLKLVDAFCFSEKNLFKLNCEVITLGENSYNHALLNKVIKKWLSGDFQNVKILSILMEHVPVSGLKVIFDGAEMKNWEPTTRRRYYKSQFVLYDCRNGWDIVRGDGKLATILFAEYSFKLFVWDERFPDYSLPLGMHYARIPKQPILKAKKFDIKNFRLHEMLLNLDTFEPENFFY